MTIAQVLQCKKSKSSKRQFHCPSTFLWCSSTKRHFIPLLGHTKLRPLAFQGHCTQAECHIQTYLESYYTNHWLNDGIHTVCERVNILWKQLIFGGFRTKSAN